LSNYTVAAGGERLDRIAKAIYGTENNGAVEALLDANPGLAALGGTIPEGTVIAVPGEVAAPDAGYVLAWE
jgi:phage tail protein X